jgi:hypothetical protein
MSIPANAKHFFKRILHTVTYELNMDPYKAKPKHNFLNKKHNTTNIWFSL